MDVLSTFAVSWINEADYIDKNVQACYERYQNNGE